MFQLKPVLLALFAAVAVILLAGCNQKPDLRVAQYDTRIAALENDNARLNATVGELLKQSDDLLQAVKLLGTNVSNSQEYYNQLNPIDPATGKTVLDARVDDLSATVSNLIVSLNAKSTARTAQYAPRPQTQALPGQMPADVAAQIRADAEKKWPGNYQMQEYEINLQTESWQKLHP